jgi:tripartite-type tricarboxylate transporter receptor subunit TctC
MKMITIAAAIAVAIGGVDGAHAQAYPAHPITIIVPPRWRQLTRHGGSERT